MKKIFRFHSGFSIAELMITMLITMLIAAALVPVIGPRKVRSADPRQSHGIAECYWDQNPSSPTYGSLIYYYADNKSHKNPADQITENVTSKGYCTFEVPKGSFYDVYAVGAGSRGTGLPEDTNLTQDVTTQVRYTRGITLMPYGPGGAGATQFSRDLHENIIAHVGNEDNENLIPGHKLDEIVKTSVTRWADRINHMAELTEAGKNPQEDDGTYASSGYNAAGEYLYAEFRGIRGPIGAGGAGYSIINVPYYMLESESCPAICAAFGYGSEACPESTYSASQNILYSDTAKVAAVRASAMPTAEPAGICKYYHLHAKGGNSANAIGFDSSTSLLIPIDATSEPNMLPGHPAYMKDDNILTVDSHDKLQISIKPRYGEWANNIQLSTSYPGGNAILNTTLSHGSNGTNGIYYAKCNVTHVNTVPMKTLKGGSMSNFACSDMSASISGEAGSPIGLTGTEQGRRYRSGSYPLAGSAHGMGSAGNYGNADTLFTWSINEPKIDISYTTAGRAGNLRTLTFSHLKGPIYLKPGQNIEGVITHTYVYTDEENMAASTILMAESLPDNIAEKSGSYTLSEMGDSPLPPERIIGEAYPDNQKLRQYIEAVRSVREWGLGGGLLAECAAFSGSEFEACMNNRSWPGYGGSGAFPILGNRSVDYVLTLMNRQNYVSSYADTDVRKKYNRKFPRNLELSLTCPDGYHDPMEDAVAEDGEEIVHYCTAPNMRRDGAVIILW